MPYLLFSGELNELEQTTNSDLETKLCVVIRRGHRRDQKIDGDYNLAILERIQDEEHKIAIFMCVGVRGDSSWGATEYLIRHWKELNSKFDNKPFALCLGFPLTQSYMQEYEEPTLLLRLPPDS